MTEILFIATDPVILTLIENLQQLVEPGIRLESDYTVGVKRIFDTRPAVVFLQHTIGNVTCDKLANQVKMLLDGEAVPLVLLSDESVISYSVVSTYEACFDLCLPLDELSRQVQQLLRALPAIVWKDAAPAPLEPGALTPAPELEITLPDAIADFSRPLPWHEQVAGAPEAASPVTEYGTLEELEGNDVLPAGPPGTPEPAPDEPHFLADFLEERFVIESLPLFFDGPDQPGNTALKPEAAPAKPFSDYHRIEKEDPNQLFGSMSESGAEPSFSQAKPVGRKPSARLVPPATPRSAASAWKKADSSAPPVRQPAIPRPESAQEPADQLPESVLTELGIGKGEPRYYRVLVIGMLLVFCIAALDLLFTLHTGRLAPPQMAAGLAGAPIAHPVPPAAKLPQFIPQVAPDPGYAASHPGWERYQADGLQYLVYRERGGIRAVQVLSEERGAITASFLKTCIRMSSGNDQFVARKTEDRSGIQVSTGTMQNGGELLIYRAIPGGEIRGFVISFPTSG